MKADKGAQLVWLVVRVQSGLPAMVAVYDNPSSALAKECEWRQGMNVEYDETDVFATEVRHEPHSPSPVHTSR